MAIVDFYSMIPSSQIAQMNPEDAIRQLAYSQERLLKNLQYSQYNYGEENFNETELANITSPIYAKIEDGESKLTELEVTADKVSAMVQAVGEDGVITAASIIASINEDTSSVQISADHIDLSGHVTISALGSSGQVTINGGNITTGTLDADLITTGSLSADRISSGTISSSIFKSEYNNDYAMKLTAGYIKFFDYGYESTKYGKIWYNDNDGRMYVHSETILKLRAEGDASLSCGAGQTLYINNTGKTTAFYGDVDFSNATVTGL